MFCSSFLLKKLTKCPTAGKTHPLTQEPLRIKRLDVPPGSFISFCHHMPHWVGARAPGAPTRWAALFAYRTPDPELHGGQKWGTAAPVCQLP